MQSSEVHVKGSGCPKCAKNRSANLMRMTTDEFIQKAQNIHGCKYNYEKTIYTGAYNNVIIICPVHGEFEQSATNHLAPHDCPSCSKQISAIKRTSSTDEFIQKAQSIHNNRYDYSYVSYNGVYKNIDIVCSIHGKFSQSPTSHLGGHGCPICSCEINADKLRSNIVDFTKKANIVHNFKYDYSASIYRDSFTHITIICPVHGVFEQPPGRHLMGAGCRSCSKLGHSGIAIKWLQKIMDCDNIIIQHALNGGEYKIPTTNFYADGYCASTNTIYEFHGDIFHGNPLLFERHVKCNYFNDKTAGELYDKTIAKEKKIIELGYNLVVMWENDFKKQFINTGSV